MTSETFQQPLLQVAQLSVSFPSPQGLIEAVNALSFDVHAGEVLALVGESGSGKSVTARTLVGLAGAGAAVRAESLILHGHDGLSQNLLACDARRWQQLRGREIFGSNLRTVVVGGAVEATHLTHCAGEIGFSLLQGDGGIA